MRINKYLASCGLGSRRGVEQLVKSGRIAINNHKISSLSCDVCDHDKVTFDDKPVSPKKYKYFAVYKPVGYVCTNEDPFASKKITDLSPELVGLSIVGRLDKDSEGLVLLSNDGDFVYKHQHPKNICEKEYLVEVRISNETSSVELDNVMRYFACGTILSGYRTRPAKIKLLAKEGRCARFNIVLTEGRKRQIREVFAKKRIPVLRLKRIRIGGYSLEGLHEGEVKQILF